MRRLRVLALVPDLHFGGGESRLLNIAAAIDKTRFDYKVATLYPPNDQLALQLGDMRHAFAKSDIAITHLHCTRPRPLCCQVLQLPCTTVLLARTIATLRRLLIEMRPDVIDAHLPPTVLTAVPAALLAGLPVALTLYHPESAGFARRCLVNAGIRRVSALITDSRRRAEDLVQSTGRGWGGVYVIPNGVRLPGPSRSRADMRTAFGIPETTTFVIGQIAGIVPTKGYEVLLEAAARFLRSYRNTVLLCVGYPRHGNDYVDYLKRLATQLGIAQQVRIQSWPGNIADVWSIVDMHVHASYFDSLPNAILEGMSLGRPSVVTSTGGIPELVTNEETGLIVPPRDVTALVNAVIRLLNDERLRVRLGCAAKARFQERCTPEATTRELERVFCTLAGWDVPVRLAASAAI